MSAPRSTYDLCRVVGVHDLSPDLGQEVVLQPVGPGDFKGPFSADLTSLLRVFRVAEDQDHAPASEWTTDPAELPVIA